MGRLIQETRIYINPNELRRIAAEMDKEAGNLMVGDHIPKHLICQRDNELIYLIWDQDNWRVE
jgi:hypothetical protein